MNENEKQESEVDSTQSVGDIMSDAAQAALKKLVMLAGMAVYIAGVVYAEVHGFSILSKGVNPDMLIWAYLGMVALGISAIALPLALHVWAFDAMHRIATLAFYVLDIALLGTNSFVDFGVNTGETLPQWAQMYKDFIMPATPVIAAVGWCILFLLDPATKALIQKHTLKAAIREALSKQIIESAKSSNVTSAVNAAARVEVDDALSSLFGKKAVIVDRRKRVEVKQEALSDKPKEDAPAPDAPFQDGKPSH
jgi:hypothetical protein